MVKLKNLLKAILIFFLALEIICWIFPYDKRGDHQADYQASIDEIRMKKVTRVGHPYFGTVFRTDIKVNNMGFTAPIDYPYLPKADEFIVGIFGGSVAHDFAVDVADEFAAMLQKNNPSLKDKKVKVLNMAVHGFKQPQQFFAASYFMPWVHLSVNLDGYNELYEGDPNFPIDYPTNARFFTISTIDKARELYFAGLGFEFQKLIARIPLIIPGLSYCQSYHRIWHVIDQRLEDSVNKVVNSHSQAGPGSHPMDARIMVWARYTSDQALFYKMRNKIAYFFIQPNQYDRGSKTFSAEELKKAYKGPNEKLEQWYHMLRATGSKLKASGINMIDLTRIFADSNETIYIDDCCHVNRKGNLIMAEAMAGKIKIP